MKAIEEPPSLVDLRKRVAARMPEVDVSEASVEVLGMVPEFVAAVTSISGAAPRVTGRDVAGAACLPAEAVKGD